MIGFRITRACGCETDWPVEFEDGQPHWGKPVTRPAEGHEENCSYEQINDHIMVVNGVELLIDMPKF